MRMKATHPLFLLLFHSSGQPILLLTESLWSVLLSAVQVRVLVSTSGTDPQ